MSQRTRDGDRTRREWAVSSALTGRPSSVVCSRGTRPGAQRHVGNLVQVRAARAAGCLDRHALQHCHDVAGVVGRIELRRDFSGADGALQALPQHHFAGGAPPDQFIPDLVRGLAARHRAAHEQAAARIAVFGQEIGAGVQQVLDHLACGRRRAGHVPEAGVPLDVAVNHLAEQTFLVAVGGIEARRIDTHRLGQVGDRGAFVAVAPEYLQGLVEGLVQIELSWASHCHGVGSFYFFIDHYINRLTASVQRLHCVSIDT